MEEKNQAKKHSRLATLYKSAGMTAIGLGSLGGFYGYQSLTNFEDFSQNINNFVMIEEQSMKLDIIFALPFLAGMLVFMWIMRKKNPEFFRTKVSFTLLSFTFTLYLIYSIIQVTMFSLVGATLGAIIDEFVMTPLANTQSEKAGDEKSLALETKKEQQRIKARQRAENDARGV